MASKIIFSNLSRNDDYTILLNGQDRGTVLPLKTITIDVEPGKYELDIKGSNEEGLPSMCKPIQIRIRGLQDPSICRSSPGTLRSAYTTRRELS